MSNVWSEGLSKNNKFDKFECNFVYHKKMPVYDPKYNAIFNRSYRLSK